MFSEKWVPPWTNLEKHPTEEQQALSVPLEWRCSRGQEIFWLPEAGSIVNSLAASGVSLSERGPPLAALGVQGGLGMQSPLARVRGE